MDLPSMPESAFDPILGDATGAGLIFGATGGMMETSLRTVAALMDPNTEPRMEYLVLRRDRRHKTRVRAYWRPRAQPFRLFTTSSWANRAARRPTTFSTPSTRRACRMGFRGNTRVTGSYLDAVVIVTPA